MFQVGSQAGKVNFFPSFVLLRPSVDWVLPTSTGEAWARASCFTPSTDSNASLIWEHPHSQVYPEIVLTKYLGDPVNFSHKINHHTPLLYLTPRGLESLSLTYYTAGVMQTYVSEALAPWQWSHFFPLKPVYKARLRISDVLSWVQEKSKQRKYSWFLYSSSGRAANIFAAVYMFKGLCLDYLGCSSQKPCWGGAVSGFQLSQWVLS